MKAMRFNLLGAIAGAAARKGIFFSLVLLSAIFSGCSDDKKEQSPPLIIFDEKAFLAEIAGSDNIFDLIEIKRDFETTKEQSPPVNRALEQRWQELISGLVPLGSPCPEAELLAFDYRRLDDKRCRADYLFKINRRLPADLRIALYGEVAPEHLDRLSENRKAAGKKSEVWTFNPEPPTVAWQPGEYLSLSQSFISPAIPYNMSMNFYAPTQKPGQYGDTVQLGWRRGITESVLLDSIRRTDSLIDLYRLKGDCDNLPAAQEAFKQKASELFEKTAPLGIICEEADLVAFDYRQIGENQYRVDYLFRVSRPFEHDCLIGLYGVVDENHRDLLSEERKKLGKRSEEWTFRPSPPPVPGRLESVSLSRKRLKPNRSRTTCIPCSMIVKSGGSTVGRCLWAGGRIRAARGRKEIKGERAAGKFKGRHLPDK